MAEYFDYPDFVARFYDVVYGKIISGEDRTYYLKQIGDAAGAVLEVGVGTGRVFLEALDSGVDIYGIDISGSMIRKLKTKTDASQRHRLDIQNVVHLDLDKKFTLIIAPFRVFSHILDTEDQLRALNRIYDHLESGGRLIFDLFVPNMQLLLEGLDKMVDFEGEYAPGKRLKRISSMQADPINQISHVSMQFIWDEEEGQITKEWRFPIRYYFRYELEHLIHRSLLTLENIYGDFKENELSSDSREFIIVCRREN